MKKFILLVFAAMFGSLVSCTKETIVINDPAIVGGVLTLYSGDLHHVVLDAEGLTLTWSSSDPNVAAVYSSYVSAMAPGKATITVSSAKASASFLVIVNRRPIESYSLSRYSLDLNLFEEGEVEVSLVPESCSAADLYIEVLDPKVASVRFDKTHIIVKGLYPGETSVLVNNGIVEEDLTVRVNGVSVSASAVSARKGKTISHSINIPSSFPSSILSVNSANTSIARASFDSENRLEVTGVSEGETELTVKVMDIETKIPVVVTDGPLLGDYYFSDGTFAEELDPEKTAVGIVYKIEGKTAMVFRCAGEGFLYKSNYSADYKDYYYWDTETVQRGATSMSDGAANTSKCSSYSGNIAYQAARLTGEGVNWYIPSLHEAVELCLSLAGYKFVQSNPGGEWEMTIDGIPTITKIDNRYYNCRQSHLDMYETRFSDAVSYSMLNIGDGWSHTGLNIWSSTEVSQASAYYVYMSENSYDHVNINSVTLKTTSSLKTTSQKALPIGKVSF